MEFKDVSDEVKRTYTFPGGDQVVIDSPLKLNVSASGGHRLVDAANVSHYVPSGWIHLAFTVKPGAPSFAF